MKLTHHKLEPFPCNDCVDFYSNKTKYRKHLAEHHSIFPMLKNLSGVSRRKRVKFTVFTVGAS